GGLLAALRAVPRPVARRLAALLDGRAGSRRSRAGETLVFATKALAARGEANFLGAYLSTQAQASDETWRTLAPLARAAPFGPRAALVTRWAGRFAGLTEPADLAMAWDRSAYLPDDLLLKEDRMTMAVSVEGRVPFLDE